MNANEAEIIAWREIKGLSWKEIEKEIQKRHSMFKLDMSIIKKVFADRWGTGVWVEDKK